MNNNALGTTDAIASVYGIAPGGMKIEVTDRDLLGSVKIDDLKLYVQNLGYEETVREYPYSNRTSYVHKTAPFMMEPNGEPHDFVHVPIEIENDHWNAVKYICDYLAMREKRPAFDILIDLLEMKESA